MEPTIQELFRVAWESGQPVLFVVAGVVAAIWAIRRCGPRVIALVPWIGPRIAPFLERLLKDERVPMVMAFLGTLGAFVVMGWSAGTGWLRLIVWAALSAWLEMGAANSKKLVWPNKKDKALAAAQDEVEGLAEQNARLRLLVGELEDRKAEIAKAASAIERASLAANPKPRPGR